MSLKQQFQVFIGTIFLTLFACFLYSVFNRLFYKKHSTFIRFIFESIFFILCFYGYFRFIVYVCHAKLNIHYLLAALLGISFYYSFYSCYVNRYLENKAIKINNKILLPIRLKINNIRDIIKRKKRRKKNDQKQTSDA